jgi:formylglycine-generating enzyme required for sulfatase activity
MAATPVQAMLHIPAGSFLMGDTLSDPAATATYALPQHTVTLSAFTLESHEVMYTQWRDVYDWAITNGYTFDDPGRNGTFDIGTNMPVTLINWYDVVKWLNARSEKEGRTPVYYTDGTHTVVYRTGNIDLVNAAVDWAANGYRLPTDAEYEYASRGGLVGKTYPWGDVLSSALANFDRGTSTSVGSYPVTGYGLYDIAGNVWEWTWDRQYTDYSADVGGVTNPHGNDTAVNRTRRGGAYVYGDRYLRNFDKMFRTPSYTGPYFGFRAASSQP